MFNLYEELTKIEIILNKEIEVYKVILEDEERKVNSIIDTRLQDVHMYCDHQNEKMKEANELRKLRESTGMNRKEFCEYFEIPYMTETDWELGNRRVPQYLLRLMAYKIQMEKLADKRNPDDKEDEVTNR